MSCLGESINHCEDGGVARRVGKTSNKVHEELGPQSLGYWKRAVELSWALLLSTDGADCQSHEHLS